MCAAGSSPLARGLRVEGEQGIEHARIIPARAGFTRKPSSCRCPGSDHPRSRGVYRTGSGSSSSSGGSSPLARGLRAGADRWVLGRRIIPARAGFTRLLPHRRLTPVGSSPLARGLLPARLGISGSPGIIPARAGFTGGGALSPVIATGSSPLARGLPAAAAASMIDVGIIPARAGFTFRWRRA